MAVPTHVAAALSGATYGQSVYWRSTDLDLLQPEYRDGRALMYSFDVVALRTFAYLRAEAVMSPTTSSLAWCKTDWHPRR